MDYGKKFIIIGNINAIAYKEIFPYIKNNELWLGNQNVKEFRSPNGEIKKFGNILWYTNIQHKKRNTPLDLYKRYSNEYPKYDNYDAIEVSKVSDIPMDYDGVMGVPITFLDKYCPEQFEILGSTQRGCHDLVPDTKKYNDYKEIKQDGTFTGSSGNKTNENANILGKPSKGNYFINNDGRAIHSLYGRILIRKRNA